jgi:raffinose/stachyose/melibiose transport system substrate-binding protein/xylobiose transport system substrate-binding protein
MRRAARLLRSAGYLFATVALVFPAACGDSDSGSGSESGTIQLWTLQNDQQNPVTKAAIDEFNKNSDIKVEMSTFVNEPYKQKLQVAMGSPNQPDIFFNWGGGNLGQFVDANQVADLTEAMDKNPKVADAFIPAVYEVGKIGGKVYGLPLGSMQPVLLFINKEVFNKAGVAPPKTYDDLLALIEVFKGRDIIPIALAGSQGWTELMYLMNLLDRVGGPEKYANISSGKAGAWRDPAVIRALTMCQDLAKRGAFGANFSSINYDNTGAGKLFATGKAAMHLMGTWEYSSQLANNPDFARKFLGWTLFPAVVDGAGDPRNVVGPPNNFFSVAAGSKHRDAAIDFLVKTLTSDSYVQGLVKAGEVPAVKGADEKMANTENVDFTTFVFKTVSEAPSFTPAWDQDLKPSVGTEINSNLQKLFLSQITPEDFASTMEKVK